jgi:hypothetical protein
MKLTHLPAALAVLLTCLGLGPPAVAAPDPSSRDRQQVVLRGTLLDDGRPLAGTVWYWIEDQRVGAPGTPAAPRTGSLYVGSDGRYEIRLSAARLPPYLVDRGRQVDLFLVAESGLRQLTYATSVDLRSGVPVVADLRLGSDPALVKVPAVSSLARLDPAGCATVNGPKHRLQEKFMKVENWRGAPATVTQGRSSSHTLGIGVGTSFSGSPVRWHLAGTDTVSRSIEESQSGIVQKWAWNLVNYQDVQTTCSDGRGNTTRYTTRSPTGINTAFSRFTIAGSSPLLTEHCQRRKRGYDLTKNTARNETVSGGVDLGPISVSAQSGWNEGTKYHVDVTRISWQCWNNKDGVNDSSVVQFRSRRYQAEPCGRGAPRCWRPDGLH